MTRPWLSILLPVYNVSAFLDDCFASLFKQQLDGVEIIAINDCSTDDSLAKLNAITQASSFPVTILQHAQNRGLSASRNTMLEASQGEYIWFLDSDDALHPGAVAELRKIVSQHAPDLILCDFNVWRANSTFKHQLRGENHKKTFSGPAAQLLTDPEALFEGIYHARNLHIWSKISRRELWGDDLRFPEGKVMEDMVITPRLALRAKNYFYQPQVWVAYRQREGSILSTLNIKKIDDMSTASAGVLSLWLEKYPQLSSRARFAFCYLCIKTHIVITRDLRKLQKNPDLTIYRERLFSHIHISKPALYWQYIKRGWLLRLIRFLFEH
jgi:glycosyltransferase involved in cell wall biosynthesis